jgi:hypothetical protein
MMKKNLIISAFLMSLVLLGAGYSETFPAGAEPGNIDPEIYLIDTLFDIGLDDVGGGSTPDGFDAQLDGSVTPGCPRKQQYAFTGEQVLEVIVTRDLNGAADLSYAKVTVDTYTEALCAEAIPEYDDGWYVDLPDSEMRVRIPDDVPPAGDAADEPGFNLTFDKAYVCLWTVEPTWHGESTVNIDVYDQSGASSNDGIAQQWFFNPVIMVDLETNNAAPSIEFEEGVPGETVYSTNKLVITNLAEGAVDLRTWIGASDFTDPSHSGALCPVSNVLDTEDTMEYRGKKGSFFGEWNWITNKNPSDGCEFEGTCLGLQDPVWDGTTDEQIIENQHDIEVEFRLTYPIPCMGDFTEGNIYVIVRAV